MARSKNRPNRHGVKRCIQCKHYLDIESFGLSRDRYDGRQAVCIGCRRKPGLKSAKEQIEELAKNISNNPRMFKETVVLLVPTIPMYELLEKKLFKQWKFPEVCAYDLWLQDRNKY